ncbi:hypothetical protein RFI_26037 [Reticulomyxa filosa]|uniref:Up-regulated in Daf-2 domain-containing protein n=1 Tax=Reticulomyxa filosa TaxID=46433 RepID=X6ME78_RETFI|nr:hypothetical protein RFI_26037 [Reticulomyxa filosa]|eukprot:ETO11340.1 hypothetical protein RFI_26037 [Reticulomyxa filosa]
MGNSCSTTVRVQNSFGKTLKRVTVIHRFRADGDPEEATWYNVSNGEITSDKLRVHYKVGFGNKTCYDWWKVIFIDNDDVEYLTDPCYSGAGYKSCYLKKEDEEGPVTIRIPPIIVTVCIEINPCRSSAASVNWSANPGSGFRCVTKVTGDIGRSQIVQGVGLAVLSLATGVGVIGVVGTAAGIALAADEVCLFSLGCSCNFKKIKIKMLLVDYYCPSCGENVWAFSGFEGNTCWICKKSNPLGNKGVWSSLINYRGKKVDLWYDSNGYVNINGNLFKNVIPEWRWKNSQRYEENSGSYVCGLNAINLGLKLWDYDIQLKKENYAHESFLHWKWGMSNRNFYDNNIKAVFKYCDYRTSESVASGIGFAWDYINENNYSAYTIIALGGYGLGGHFFLIVGVDTNKTNYLVTDQSRQVWLADQKLMRTLSVYSHSGYTQNSFYKIG